MTTIAVIGLGTMGLGIAAVYAAAGHRVLVTDASADARDSAFARLEATLPKTTAPKDLDRILAHLTLVDRLSDLDGADLVIEAIAEDLAAKQTLFTQLEDIVRPGCVLATNTSSLSVAALAAPLSRPERLLGLHFFNPAPVMRLVERVAHPGTSHSALELARTLTEAAGKVVIDAPDRPGFIVNRCARPFYGEALALLEEGHSPAAIDGAMLAAGYRLGPFALIDLIGADINLAATQGLYHAMGHHPRYYPFAALREQVAQGDLGRKTGRGFLYPDRAAPAVNPSLVLRIEAALVNEADWLLAEGGTRADGVDTAVRLGLNFPRGPSQMREAHGPEVIAATLRALEAAAPAHLKSRYLPPGKAI